MFWAWTAHAALPEPRYLHMAANWRRRCPHRILRRLAEATLRCGGMGPRFGAGVLRLANVGCDRRGRDGRVVARGGGETTHSRVYEMRSGDGEIEEARKSSASENNFWMSATTQSGSEVALSVLLGARAAVCEVKRSEVDGDDLVVVEGGKHPPRRVRVIRPLQVAAEQRRRSRLNATSDAHARSSRRAPSSPAARDCAASPCGSRAVATRIWSRGAPTLRARS